MSLRIGEFVLYPSIVFLPLAFGCFVLMSWRSLRSTLDGSLTGNAFVLAVAIAAGGFGAWLQGHWSSPSSDLVQGSMVWRSLGSLGAYWGILLGAAFAACRLKRSPWTVIAALLPGLVGGGVIARLSCLFAGCCPGRHFATPVLTRILHPWAIYDMAALSAAWLWSRYAGGRPNPATLLARFLFGYGVLRFGLEFLRAAPTVAGPLTAGQILCAMQVVVALAIARRGRKDGRNNP